MGLVALNRRGRVMAMTPKAQETLNLSYAETKGKKLADLLEPGTFPGWRDALREKGWEVHRPLEIIRKDKRSLIDTLTYHFPEGKVILLEDAEERTTLQRLRSWAPVAQELAHGIKNPPVHGALRRAEDQEDMPGSGGRGDAETRSERRDAETSSA